MKLSETTLLVLNNFKNLSDSMLFYPGSEIKNLSTDKSVYMTAQITDNFPNKFAIFSVREFLQVLSVVQDAEIDFREDHMFISNKYNSVIFRYANEEIVFDVYQQKLNLDSPTFSVDLPVAQIKNMFKMAHYLGIPDVAVVGGERGKLTLHDKKASHNHSYTIELNVPLDIHTVNFNISTLSMLDVGYTLSYFAAKNMVRFSGIEFPVNYHVSCAK